jgi:hypothetical protein
LTTKKPKKIGRPPRHGGFSIAVKKGEFPERRSYIRTHVTGVRDSLVRRLGPTETDLTGAQVVLIDRIISKLSIIRMIEEYTRETGAFNRRGELISVLQKSYLAWSNSLRLDLQALGIDDRAGLIDLPRDNVLRIEVVAVSKDSQAQAESARTTVSLEFADEPSDDELPAAVAELEARLAEARVARKAEAPGKGEGEIVAPARTGDEIPGNGNGGQVDESEDAEGKAQKGKA